MDRYFSGRALYGDDFTPEQIAAWFADEENAYGDMKAAAGPYTYTYHALNVRHGFRHLPPGRIGTALGLGAAFGHELRPVLDRLDRIIIVEPGRVFQQSELDGVPVEYRAPMRSGDLPAESSSVDLVTCFGVLHHIPNVSHVVAEIGRVLRPGGHAIVREPIVTMGDWRHPRPGITPRERGIPRHLLREFAERAGLSVARETLCDTPLTPRISSHWTMSDRMVQLDALLAAATAWKQRYHPVSTWQKLQPSSVCLVLRRA